MSYTNADVSATERSLLAADKPLLCGRNWLRSAGTFRGWDANGISTLTDISATGFPASCAGDDFDHALTKPNAAATSQYFIFDYGSGGMEFDMFALLKHNLGTIGGITLTLWITDDPSAEPNWTKIYDSGVVASDKRIVGLTLKSVETNAQRYSSARYVRLKTAGGSHTPQFGEFILGRRRQLKHAPNVPWDDKWKSSRISHRESASGVVTRYTFHKNRRHIAAQLSPAEDSYVSDLDTLFGTEMDGGTLPMLWIDKPNSAPSDASWMFWENAELKMPLVDYIERGVPINLIEQGPNFLALGV